MGKHVSCSKSYRCCKILSGVLLDAECDKGMITCALQLPPQSKRGYSIFK